MLLDEINAAVREAFIRLADSNAYRSYVGPAAEELTQQLSSMHAGAEVLLASSGTAALEIALRAAGIGAGDEVILCGYDYPGNFWAIERCGARPVLVDTHTDSWRIDETQLELAGKSDAVKALVISHLHGQQQAATELRATCDERGWLLVEDTCQALGARIGAASTGTIGHVGILSFGGGKVLSAGRGGCLLSKLEPLMQRARIAAGAGSGPYALSEMQAGVLLAQLPWLAELNQQVSEYFQRLSECLAVSAVHQIFPAAEQLAADPDSVALYQAGWINRYPELDRDRFVAELRQRDISAGPGFVGFHRRSPRRCRIAGDLTQTTVAANQTWVIHHRQALEGRMSADQLAHHIAETI